MSDVVGPDSGLKKGSAGMAYIRYVTEILKYEYLCEKGFAVVGVVSASANKWPLKAGLSCPSSKRGTDGVITSSHFTQLSWSIVGVDVYSSLSLSQWESWREICISSFTSHVLLELYRVRWPWPRPRQSRIKAVIIKQREIDLFVKGWLHYLAWDSDLEHADAGNRRQCLWDKYGTHTST